MGHARPAAVRWRAGDEHQKHQKPALARMVEARQPLRRAVDLVLRYADTKPKKTPTWFAFDDTRPLAVFAGLWTTWTGRRGTKSNPVEGEHTLFGFLTCEPNDVVGAVHPKAMPVTRLGRRHIVAFITQAPLLAHSLAGHGAMFKNLMFIEHRNGCFERACFAGGARRDPQRVC